VNEEISVRDRRKRTARKRRRLAAAAREQQTPDAYTPPVYRGSSPYLESSDRRIFRFFKQIALLIAIAILWWIGQALGWFPQAKTIRKSYELPSWQRPVDLSR
jgi:hypothetical protein